MTTIKFNLSSQLQHTLNNAGGDAHVYAYAFGSSTSNGTPTLVDSATLFGGTTNESSLEVTAGSFYNGVIYVVVQQGHDGDPHIGGLGDITPANAHTYNYSYQLFEATLSGSDQDQGDISSLDTFGMTATYEVVYQDGTDTRGYKVMANDIFGALPRDAIGYYVPNGFDAPSRLAIGPGQTSNWPPYAGSGWQTYVNALKKDATTLADIQIVYSFSTDGGSLSHYGVQYVESDKYGEDYFWLVPDTSNGADNTDWIRIPVSSLVNNIFVQPYDLEVHQGGKDGPIVWGPGFTPTTPSGGVAKHFVAGFDAGFWGASGTSPNALITTPLDFNKGYNWSIGYSYDMALLDGVGAATFTNSLKPANPASGDFFYDPWAQQFVVNSNAYGYSYSDLISWGGVNPQITLWDANANGGAGANVETINITLYDTKETPASGYKPPIPSWIEPPAGGYKASLTASTNQIGFNFNFELGSTVYAPNENTSITFKIYAPGSAQAADDFISFDLTTIGGSDYFYYAITDTSGTLTMAAGNPTKEAGFFNIANLPVTADGSVSWYQLVFGAGDDQSIYNIYATSDVGTGAFTEVVVDHGIEITANPNGSYTLAFAPGGHLFYDIDTFAAPPPGDPNLPGANIRGSKKADFVNALNSVAGQDGPTSGADVIFGHDGRDHLSGLAGNDIIDGGKGVDVLRGGDGNDILQVRGNEGVLDFFHGGAGTDTLQFIGNGAVTLNGFHAVNSLVEILDGNGKGLNGTKEMDVFDLRGLTAMSNLPFIDGKGGNDRLIGSDFADDLRGGAGDDILDGRGGNDILNGGGGRNTYVFGDGYGADTVVKYNAGKDAFDFRGATGVSSFADLVLTQIAPKTVLIDFGGGDALTVHKTTIAILTANQGDFLFS